MCAQEEAGARILTILKETAMRNGEAWSLQWTDIDFANKTIIVTPGKGNNPTIFKASNTLINRLEVIRVNTKTKRIFGKWLKSQRKLFYNSRRNVANKLKNPRKIRIIIHAFKHGKATTLYYQTKDILYVMNYLGHKNIKNTLMYFQLEEAIYKEVSNDYISKAATIVEVVCHLVETGFDYVCDVGEAKVFRKF